MNRVTIIIEREGSHYVERCHCDIKNDEFDILLELARCRKETLDDGTVTITRVSDTKALATLAEFILRFGLQSKGEER